MILNVINIKNIHYLVTGAQSCVVINWTRAHKGEVCQNQDDDWRLTQNLALAGSKYVTIDCD